VFSRRRHIYLLSTTMVIVDDPPSPPDFKSKNDLQLEHTSPPAEELPTFEESTNYLASDIDPPVPPNPYQDPPPDFSPYIASYATHSDGSIVSHDAHLNQDGTYPPWPHMKPHLSHCFHRRGIISLPSISCIYTSYIPSPYPRDSPRD
jgi:hypothetical protein